MVSFVRMEITSGVRSETMTLWSSDGAVRTWQFEDLFRAASLVQPVRRLVRELLDADEMDTERVRDPSPDSIRRIAAVDLSYPLIEVEGLGVIDGFHRVARAHLSGETELLVASLSVDELLAIPHSCHDASE